MPLVPAEYAQSTLNWGQLGAIMRANKARAVTITLLLFVATLLIVWLLPKSYTAQATVLVNFESNDGTRQAPPDLYTSYLSTQVALIQSREVLEGTINRLGLTKDPEFTSGFKDDGVTTLESFVEKKLDAALGVEQGKGIQLIYVSVTSRDRNKAAKIANTIVDEYSLTQGHGTDPKSRRAHEYSEQLADLKNKVTGAEQHMADFRRRTGVTDIAAQNDGETQTLATLEQQLLQAENQRRTAESRTVADQDASDQAMASQVVQGLKNQLSTLQSQLAQLTSTLGPKHPRVLELQSQIASTRHSLDHEIQALSQNTTGEVSSAAQLEAKLRRAVDDQRAKLVQIRALQDEGQKLQLELESAQTVYKRALDGFDQSMFATASLASRAVPPIEASKPNKPMLVVVGTLVALLLGLGGPVGYELLFHRRLHSRADIERDLGVPVLAELDRIPGLVSAI
jgi:polysaccharide biosynthesis transport protein